MKKWRTCIGLCLHSNCSISTPCEWTTGPMQPNTESSVHFAMRWGLRLRLSGQPKRWITVVRLTTWCIIDLQVKSQFGRCAQEEKKAQQHGKVILPLPPFSCFYAKSIYFLWLAGLPFFHFVAFHIIKRDCNKSPRAVVLLCMQASGWIRMIGISQRYMKSHIHFIIHYSFELLGFFFPVYFIVGSGLVGRIS